MTNPREPLPDSELEDCVQRSVQLLQKEGMAPEVVLRALTMSVGQIVASRQQPAQQPNLVDQMLQQGGPQQFQQQPQQPAGQYYGRPGTQRPPGIPDPGQFGPQIF